MDRLPAGCFLRNADKLECKLRAGNEEVTAALTGLELRNAKPLWPLQSVWSDALISMLACLHSAGGPSLSADQRLCPDLAAEARGGITCRADPAAAGAALRAELLLFHLSVMCVLLTCMLASGDCRQAALKELMTRPTWPHSAAGPVCSWSSLVQLAAGFRAAFLAGLALQSTAHRSCLEWPLRGLQSGCIGGAQDQTGLAACSCWACLVRDIFDAA